MKPISFKPIPGPNGGHCCLSIHPPGTWFHNTDFAVFVGGCGVGRAETLPIAKNLLFHHAKKMCQRRIREAEDIAAHYRKMEAQLDKKGLQIERG